MHLGDAGQRALDRFVAGLRRQVPERIHSVILFGSRARGDARRDSDFDLFVVVDRRDPQLLDVVFTLAQDALLEERVLLSPKVCPQDRLAEMRRLGDPLLAALARDGRDLWTPS